MKIVAVSQNQQILIELRQHLVTENSPLEVSACTGGLPQAEAAISQAHPELLIFDMKHSDHPDLEKIELLGMHHPGMAIILLIESLTPDFLAEAMRVGVREVLSLPLSGSALQSAVSRIQKRANLLNSANHQGKVLAFVPCKGGSGATFLAVNLAYILAATSQKRVVLFDLNMHFGNASLYVHDNPPTSTLADIASNIQRLDASFLASSMVHVLPNFGILAAPESPERATEVKPEHMDKLISLAIANYDFVILDISRTLDAVSLRALDRTQIIFPVLQETLPFIRDAKRMLATFKSLGYGQDKLHLLVNRYEKGGDIRLDDVEATLGMKVAHTVPNSFKATSASVNQGVPVLKIAPHDHVTKALEKIAKALAEGPNAKQGGWFSRMFK